MSKQPVISIGFDPGSSLTKVFYRVNQSDASLLVQAPEVIEVTRDSLQQRSEARFGLLSAENDAWLAMKEGLFAIGLLAREIGATASIRKLKYELATIKFLAVLGTIVERENLDPHEPIQILASVLLPYSEFSDRSKFRDSLQRAIRRFEFRGKKIRGTLLGLTASPEGGGFVWKLIHEKGKDWFARQEAVCILQLGHRNSSLLTFSHGRIETAHSHTAPLGFVQLVDKVIERTSGQDRDALTQAIYTVGGALSPTHKELQALIRSSRASHAEDELGQLIEAITAARQEYWQLMKEWLNEYIPRRVNVVVVSGGAGHYLQPELSDFLQWAHPIWATLPDEVLSQLQDDNLALDHRVVDVFYLFQHCLPIPNKRVAA